MLNPLSQSFPMKQGTQKTAMRGGGTPHERSVQVGREDEEAGKPVHRVVNGDHTPVKVSTMTNHANLFRFMDFWFIRWKWVLRNYGIPVSTKCQWKTHTLSTKHLIWNFQGPCIIGSWIKTFLTWTPAFEKVRLIKACHFIFLLDFIQKIMILVKISNSNY